MNRGKLFFSTLLLFSPILFSILSLQSRSCGALGSSFLEFGFLRMVVFNFNSSVGIWNWSLSAAGLNITVSQNGPTVQINAK